MHNTLLIAFLKKLLLKLRYSSNKPPNNFNAWPRKIQARNLRETSEIILANPLRSSERWGKLSEKWMQEEWAQQRLEKTHKRFKQICFQFTKQQQNEFSPTNMKFFPLLGCSPFPHSVSSGRWSWRLPWSPLGSSPSRGSAGLPPSPFHTPLWKWSSPQEAQNEALLQSMRLIHWMPQTSEHARLDFWLAFTIRQTLFHNLRSCWAARQLHFPVCHQQGITAHNHRALHMPRSGNASCAPRLWTSQLP